MTRAIHVPELGTDEMEITEILIKIGEKVLIDQPLLTVEGNKVSIEIPSPCNGKITSIQVKVKDKIRTGQLIMFVEEIKTTIHQVINNPETKKYLFLRNKNLNRNNEKYYIDSPNQDTEKNKESTQIHTSVYATPCIRRLARKLCIDLTQINGTGRNNRILNEDIEFYIQNFKKNNQSLFLEKNDNLINLKISQNPKIDFKIFGEIEEIDLGKIQQISGKNLHRNWITIPHVTQFDEVDITEIEEFRKQQNLQIEKNAINSKITLLTFILKAVAHALQKFPYLNSSISEDGKKIILKKYINIGIAVNTNNGLLVPVLRNILQKGIIELSHELIYISEKARSGKLTISDTQGGSFTVSNLGSIGGTAFTPIINTLEVAILGISRSSIKAIWNGKKFVPKLLLPISLSYDHRVINGIDGARFISLVKQLISDIRRLIL